MNLIVDEQRWELFDTLEPTGFFVHAMLPDNSWDYVDVIYLTNHSLLKWLRSRGGDNHFAENVVLLLFGHNSIKTV